jgi:hypothetical protein
MPRYGVTRSTTAARQQSARCSFGGTWRVQASCADAPRRRAGLDRRGAERDERLRRGWQFARAASAAVPECVTLVICVSGVGSLKQAVPARFPAHLPAHCTPSAGTCAAVAALPLGGDRVTSAHWGAAIDSKIAMAEDDSKLVGVIGDEVRFPANCASFRPIPRSRLPAWLAAILRGRGIPVAACLCRAAARGLRRA